MPDYLNSDDYDRRGFEFLENGRFEEAIEVFREAIRLYPYSADLHSGLGHAYGELGEYVMASRSFQQGLYYSPCDEDMWLGLGLCYLKLNRIEDAESCIGHAEERVRSDPETCLSLAFAYYQAEMPEEAAPCCSRALEFEPDNAEALALLGVCLQETDGDLEEIHRCMATAIEFEPERWDWAEYYANFLYEEKNRYLAFQYFDRIPLDEMRIPDSFKRLYKLLKRYRKDSRKMRECRRCAAEAVKQDSLDFFLESLQEETETADEWGL